MRCALLLAVGLATLPIGAPARAKDNGSCAQFEAPLAYNACLASHGPRAGETRAIAAPDDDVGAKRAFGGRRGRGGGEALRGKRGRARMEFDESGERGDQAE
jgi:hypothetical protein